MENAPSLKDAIRLTWALVDQWMASEIGSPRLSFSISTTPAMSCTGISSSRSSTPLRRALLSADPCLRHRAPASVAVVLRSGKTPSGVECAPSAPARAPYPPTLDEDAHHFEATATTPDPRRWNGARPTASITSSGCRFEAAGEENRRGGGSGAHRARLSNKPVVRGYAETPTRPNPGTASGAPSPHRATRSGSTPVSSSPTSNTARRNGFTTPLLRARAGREPHQAAQDAARFDRTPAFRDRQQDASRCTRGYGSCSPFATPSRNRAI